MVVNNLIGQLFAYIAFFVVIGISFADSIPTITATANNAAASHTRTPYSIGIFLNYDRKSECFPRHLLYSLLIQQFQLNANIKFISSFCCSEGKTADPSPSVGSACDTSTNMKIESLFNVRLLEQLYGSSDFMLFVEQLFQNDSERSHVAEALRQLQSVDIIISITDIQQFKNPASLPNEQLAVLERLLGIIPSHRRPALFPFNFDGNEATEDQINDPDMMAEFAIAIQQCFVNDTGNCVKAIEDKYSENIQRMLSYVNNSNSNRIDLQIPSYFNGKYLLYLSKSIHRQGNSNNNAEKVQSDLSATKANVPLCNLTDADRIVLDSIKQSSSLSTATADISSNSNSNSNSASNSNSNSKHSHRIRVLCMTYTHSQRHHTIRSIRATWAKSCDGYLAFSNQSDSQQSILHLIPVVATAASAATAASDDHMQLDEEHSYGVYPDGQPITMTSSTSARQETYHEMWFKSQLIWGLVYSAKELFEAYDYFIIGGDDLYVLCNNLRKYLSSSVVQQFIRSSAEALYATTNTNTTPSDPNLLQQWKLDSIPIYLGRLLNVNSYLQFNSGGSGYVLNRAALSILIHSLQSPQLQQRCLKEASTSMEDLLISQCLQQAGVEPFPYSSLMANAYSDVNEEDNNHKMRVVNPEKKKKRRRGKRVMILAEERKPVVEYTSIAVVNQNLATLFHPVTPSEAFEASLDWYKQLTHLHFAGNSCCSSDSISFQNIKEPNYSMECIYSALFD